MFGAPTTSGLTFSKVLGGIAKTLNVANQVIPLYKEAKPMINNAKTILSALKEINSESKNKNKTNNNTNIKENIKKENRIRPISNVNQPQFFL